MGIFKIESPGKAHQLNSIASPILCQAYAKLKIGVFRQITSQRSGKILIIIKSKGKKFRIFGVCARKAGADTKNSELCLVRHLIDWHHLSGGNHESY
jgi:hypothetical protein